MLNHRRRFLISGWLSSLILLAFLLDARCAPPADEHDFERWKEKIRQFEEADTKQAFPTQQTVFVGSSSIRLWKTSQQFPDRRILNRGFGGSEIVDSIHYAETLFLKHRPRQIVLYAGDNDLARGRTPSEVSSDFADFVRLVRKRLPQTRIAFIAVKPSIKRWELIEQIQSANQLILEQCTKDKQLDFVDIFSPMLGSDGKPRAALFADDGLHLNDKGYELWKTTLLPILVKHGQ